MGSINYLKLIQSNWRFIVTVVLSTVILSLLLSLTQPILYSSTVRLLVIQRSALTLDPYTALKSAERIGDNLSQIIYTSTFFDKVLDSGFDIDAKVFSMDERKKRKQWQKMVRTQVARGTGMLKIDVLHKDKEQATQIANAIAYVLTIEGWEYIGGDLQIRLVDAPLQSRFPVKPDFLLNSIMGLIFGLILGVAYVILRAEKFSRKKYDFFK